MAKDLPFRVQLASAVEYFSGSVLEPVGQRDEDVFTISVHILFDDSHLCEDTEAELEYTLMNMREVELVRALCGALGAMFTVLGTERIVQEYKASTFWPAIVDASKNLEAEMRANGWSTTPA